MLRLYTSDPLEASLCNLCVCISAEVVCLDCSLLLFHQFCKLQKLRGHQADDEQLHVSIQLNVSFLHQVHDKFKDLHNHYN